MNEDDILYNGDSEESFASDSDAIEIDYEKIEDAYYNALKRIETEKEVQNLINDDSVNDSDLVEFSSETDAHLYTVGVADATTTCSQQQLTYILDIRNILLLFLFCYFCLSVYSKLKTTMINYTK